MSQLQSLPELSNPDPEPADGVRVGDSPVRGLTLRRILRGHQDGINRIAWSPDGRYLASPSEDTTIRIWDVERGECIFVITEETGSFNLAWSPNGQELAADILESIHIWNTATWKPIKSIRTKSKHGSGHLRIIAWSPTDDRLAYGGTGNLVGILDAKTAEHLWAWDQDIGWIDCLAWSQDGEGIAAGDEEHRIHIWNTRSGELSDELLGHENLVLDLKWMPQGKTLLSSSSDETIRVWNLDSGERLALEGHTKGVVSLSVSHDGGLLASKSDDQTVRMWDTRDWTTIAELPETTRGGPIPIRGLAFHPHLPILATLGVEDTVIRIWEVDTDILLGHITPRPVRYTTAKLVLVGDSGVGKTGLGWRLAHGEFKEHASTHGQQFWVVDDLRNVRTDGTECEAVLWDVAGQHVYRPIHSIFLDKVDASLVLFDPTNRQDPLKGAQFWLEQLKGKGRLPPTVLVGARVDRGALATSQEYLEQFCQRYGISGGYVGTSAKRGDGLQDLLQVLQTQIPWDSMTTTVTTVTFKRIKDFVLELKEEPDRQNVLVQPGELRQQLQATDPDWQFTDPEMMTAVGHLETHGYVTILRSSSGEEYVLLTPDLLVDLASSIVLLADKHPRELGAVSETQLLQGRYPFEELERLDEAERHILLDAAELRFLEHNVCFRETFDEDTLLIFPGLIKQKRPLEDDFTATDDVSYVVRGRVENLYAMLVVLLGYTPTFVRINQWQNQAQYEMGEGEICGFRVVEDREGEIELVLYYSEQMPRSGRSEFQALFERFLYQREVEVTRFPPVVCPNDHRLERATVVGRIREGKDFAFCAECGSKVDLPELDQPGIGTGASAWLQREEAVARLRSTYEAHLARVKSYRRAWAAPRCYLSHAHGQESHAEKLRRDLQEAGVYSIQEPEEVRPEDFVVVLDTPAYQKAFRDPSAEFAADVEIVKKRLHKDKSRLISIQTDGGSPASAPHDLHGCTAGDFRDATHYPVSLFNLVLELYAIPFTHAGFAPLRASLHQQWERTLASIEEDVSTPGRRFSVAVSFPGEHRNFVKKVARGLAAKWGRERVFYDRDYEAELARPDLDTYLQEIYHDQAELVVVFLSADYERKEWCGLEWRAVRDLLKRRRTAEIMPVRFDDTHIPGLFSIDGYLDVRDRDPEDVAELISQRLELNRKANE